MWEERQVSATQTQDAVVLFAVETAYVSKHTCPRQPSLRELLVAPSGFEMRRVWDDQLGSDRRSSAVASRTLLRLNFFHADFHSKTDGCAAPISVARCDAILTSLQPFEQTRICLSSKQPGCSFCSGSIRLRLIPLTVTRQLNCNLDKQQAV